MKQGLRSSGCLGLSAIGGIIRIKIVQIGIHIALASSSVAIAHPYSIEGISSPERESQLKVSDSGLQNREFSFKDVTKERAVPSSKRGIKLVEGFQNNGAKFGRSIAICDIALASI